MFQAEYILQFYKVSKKYEDNPVLKIYNGELIHEDIRRSKNIAPPFWPPQQMEMSGKLQALDASIQGIEPPVPTG